MSARDDQTTSLPGRWSRVRRLLYWAIVLELAGIALFLLVLVIGEQSRLTLISLYLPRQPLLAAAILGALLSPLARNAAAPPERQKRRLRALLAIHAILALVIVFPIMGVRFGSSRPPTRDGATIRLASYNVFFGKLGRPALIDEIVAMQADIIVLQAAFGSLGERLKERLPDRTIRQEGELVLVSRFPVRTVEAPPPLGKNEPAMFMKYVIDTPTGALRVVNVHPYSPRHALLGGDASGDNIADREAQIGAAVDAARSDVPPFVIAGDTNLPPMSGIGRRRLAGLTDAFTEVGFGFGYTFPAKRPWMRIDRVFAGDRVRFLDMRIGPRGASDHRPVFVDLELIDH